MCGITGWISYERDLRAEAHILDRMTATMECRGPDDRGAWIDGVYKAQPIAPGIPCVIYSALRPSAMLIGLAGSVIVEFSTIGIDSNPISRSR